MTSVQLPAPMISTGWNGGFVKPEVEQSHPSPPVQPRKPDAPRVSSGYVTPDSKTRSNSNGRRFGGNNQSTSNSSIAHSIAHEVINKSVASIRNQQRNKEVAESTQNSGNSTSVKPPEVENSPDEMPPNDQRLSSGATTEDTTAIISGHKIALSVKYGQDGHSDVPTQNGTVAHMSPPNSAAGDVTPVVIDETPALEELDAVIASAAAAQQNTPEHFVDAPETFHADDHDNKVTHVDQLEAPRAELAASLPVSPHPSSLSLKEQHRVSDCSLEEAKTPSGSSTSSSTTSVDGQVEHKAAVMEEPQQSSVAMQNEFLNGPDQVIPSDKLKTWLPDGAVKLRVEERGVASYAPLSIPTALRKTAEKYPNHNALMEKQGNEWVAMSYSQYYQQVRHVAKAFIKLGLDPFHGVCILGFNSPQWFISDLAAIFAGGFAAGIYTTNSPEACELCAQNCKAQIWVVEDQKQLDKVLQIRDNVPSLKHIIQYRGKPTTEGVLSWEEVVQMGIKESDHELEERLKRIAVNQCCVLIYTSGTTGPPKGVMLSHDNVTWTALSVSIYANMKLAEESVVSYLPLSHIAAQLADIHLTIINAGTTYFAKPDALKGSLGVTLKEVRPTAFLGVPRVWEKIYEKMMDVGKKTKGLKKSIATWAKSVGLESNERKQRADYSKPMGFTIANAVVFKKVKQVLGLDRCHIFLSGAAPIAPEIVKYFHSLDICLTEIYGMSESTGPHTTGLESAFKVGSAGRTIPGCVTKIINPDKDGNGEVCMGGRNVSMGYLRNEEKTHEAIDDEGLLHSGDIGKIDSDDFLFITGRLKELIITAGGENIPPVLVEDLLKAELPCISNAMLIGDKRKFLSILLTLKTDMNPDTGDALDTLSPACLEWCESVGSTAKTIYDVLSGPDAKIMRAIQDGIDRTNNKATSNAQRIQKWTILPKDFTVPGDELGPTMKLKRPVVAKKYAETIERFYQ